MNHVIHAKSWGSAHRAPTLGSYASNGPLLFSAWQFISLVMPTISVGSIQTLVLLSGCILLTVAPIYSIVEEFQTHDLACHFEWIPRTTLRFLSDAFYVEVSAGSGRHACQKWILKSLGKVSFSDSARFMYSALDVCCVPTWRQRRPPPSHLGTLSVLAHTGGGTRFVQWVD
jgi:hypothetical protein